MIGHWELIMILWVAIVPALFWKIFSKAGYPGAMGLLMLVPLVNLLALCFLAFGDWPISRQLRQTRGEELSIPKS